MKNVNESSKDDDKVGIPFNERQEIYAEHKRVAYKEAAEQPSYRYRSKRDPAKFKKYLTERSEKWEALKDKHFHALNMFNKTKALLHSIDDGWDMV